MVIAHKTQRPVQFETQEPTHPVIDEQTEFAALCSDSHLFPSRLHAALVHAQYAYRRSMNRGDRCGCCVVWYVHDAASQSFADSIELEDTWEMVEHTEV